VTDIPEQRRKTSMQLIRFRLSGNFALPARSSPRPQFIRGIDMWQLAEYGIGSLRERPIARNSRSCRRLKTFFAATQAAIEIVAFFGLAAAFEDKKVLQNGEV